MVGQAFDIAQEHYPEPLDDIRDREYASLRGWILLDCSVLDPLSY